MENNTEELTKTNTGLVKGHHVSRAQRSITLEELGEFLPPKIFENQLLSYKEAARYLGISESYLRRLKYRGQIGYVSIGSRGVRFKLSSLNSWVEEREII